MCHAQCLTIPELHVADYVEHRASVRQPFYSPLNKKMKVCTPQISYHGQLEGCGGKNDRILSLDYHPHTDLIVTGGADYEIKVTSPPRRSTHLLSGIDI